LSGYGAMRGCADRVALVALVALLQNSRVDRQQTLRAMGDAVSGRARSHDSGQKK